MPYTTLRSDLPFWVRTAPGVQPVSGRRYTPTPQSRTTRFIAKRMVDLALASVVLVLAWPLLVGLYVLVRLSSPGPIFYAQQRIGYRGRHFRAWKFRTMVVNADQVLQQYLAENPALRTEWECDHKLKCDPRVTWIGGMLRKTSLDELPQLWNVLRGEMSLVGPRPIVDDEVVKYGEAYALYRSVLPGITGWWQVSGRNNTSYPQRVALDAHYARAWSLGFDLYILLRTVKTVLFREGAY